MTSASDSWMRRIPAFLSVLMFVACTSDAEGTALTGEQLIALWLDGAKHFAPLVADTRTREDACRATPIDEILPGAGRVWNEQRPVEMQTVFRSHPLIDVENVPYLFGRGFGGSSEVVLLVAPWGGEAEIECAGQPATNALVVMSELHPPSYPQARLSVDEWFDLFAENVEEHGLLPVTDEVLTWKPDPCDIPPGQGTCTTSMGMEPL